MQLFILLFNLVSVLGAVYVANADIAVQNVLSLLVVHVTVNALFATIPFIAERSRAKEVKQALTSQAAVIAVQCSLLEESVLFMRAYVMESSESTPNYERLTAYGNTLASKREERALKWKPSYLRKNDESTSKA